MSYRVAGCVVCLFASLGAVHAGGYKLGADSQVQEGVPQGKVTQHTWVGKIYPKVAFRYSGCVPAQYDGKDPACVMVFQDGSAYAKPRGEFRAPVVFDDLIHQKKLPVLIAIFIDPGRIVGQADKPNPPLRSALYDT